MSDRQENRVPEPDDLSSLLETLASLPIEDGEEPQPQEVVASRAARASKSIGEIFAEDRARVRRSRYPGRECFEPYEIERYFLGDLEAERAAHMNTCAACSALLHAATPDPAKAERIVEEVREMAEVLGRAPADEPNTVRKSRVRWWRHWLPRPISAPADGLVLACGTLLGFFAATVVGAVATSWVGLRYRLWQPLSEAPGVASVVGGSILQPTIIALIAAIAVIWLTRKLVSRVGWAVFRRWGGLALAVASFVLMIVAVEYVQRDLEQRTRQTQLGLRLVSARLTEVVAASVDYRRSTGAFPQVELNAEPVVLTTALYTPDRAVYRAITDGIKGAMVADVSADGGAVYWDRGGKSKQVVRVSVGKLVLGKIDTMTTDTLVLRERRGTKVTIKAPVDPTHKLGEEVVAIVDQHTNTAIGVYPVESRALRTFQWSRRRDDSASVQGNVESKNRYLMLPDQSLPGMRSEE